MAKNYTKDYIDCVEKYVDQNAELMTLEVKYRNALEDVEENIQQFYKCVDSYQSLWDGYDLGKCEYQVSSQFDWLFSFVHSEAKSFFFIQSRFFTLL